MTKSIVFRVYTPAIVIQKETFTLNIHLVCCNG